MGTPVCTPVNAVRPASRPLLGILFALCALATHAQDGQWHFGVGAAAERQDFTYGKTVYTEESLAQGEFTSAKSGVAQTLPTLNVFAGYRWPVPGLGGLDLRAEVDVAWHPTKLKGHLEGTGYTWTDTWPEDWWLKRDHSYGLTLKLGGLLNRPDTDLYALVGIRSVVTEFTITETGCPGPDLQCPPTPLASFTDSVDRRFTAWALGAGLERRLTERLAMQLELRRTEYRRERWDRLFEGGVIIPSTLNGSEFGLALRLVVRPG